MSQPWFILTRRFGEDIYSPSAEVIRNAVDDVVDPASAHDVEHTNTLVRYGFDEGPMYTLTFDSAGSLTFEQWADQDFRSELAAAGFLFDVPAVQAAQAFNDLGRGDIAAVKARRWSRGR